MILPLSFEDHNSLRINEDRLSTNIKELDAFLDWNKNNNNLDFAKKVMYASEIKTNNQIEGYNDDVAQIEEVINRNYSGYKPEQIKRIKNLYAGYNYILKNKDINKETLKKLYSILSRDLLETGDKERMGEYYRQDTVYILRNGRIDTYPDQGVYYKNIDTFMNQYFEFLNNFKIGDTVTYEYIKSQILHLYFVYVHPYFDVNGRTSRTMAMWELLNKKAYPYIIFNRGITFKGSLYDEIIRDGIKYHDATFFIKFMLETVKCELEKEYVMETMINNSGNNFNDEDRQTILYLISMRGNLSVLDYVAVYNRFHTKKKPKEIYLSMLKPLIDKGILIVSRTTANIMFDNYSNEVLEFNPKVLEGYDKAKIKTLTKFK